MFLFLLTSMLLAPLHPRTPRYLGVVHEGAAPLWERALRPRVAGWGAAGLFAFVVDSSTAASAAPAAAAAAAAAAASSSSVAASGGVAQDGEGGEVEDEKKKAE